MFFEELLIAFYCQGLSDLIWTVIVANTLTHSLNYTVNAQTHMLSPNDEEVGYSGVSVGLSPSVAAPPFPDNSVSAGSN